MRSVTRRSSPTAPMRSTSDSKTRGQSSSVPSSRPMRRSDIPGENMSDLALPGRPVVRRVVAPDLEVVRDALLAEEAGEALGRLERAGRVFPGAPADDEDEVHLAAQPVEVVAVELADVGHRVVEVGGVAGLAPGDARRVVHPGEADGEREAVSTPQREVRGVERTHRDARDADADRAAAVG